MEIKVRHKDNQVALSFVGSPTVIRAQTDAELVASANATDSNGVDIKYSVDNVFIVQGFPFDLFKEVTNHKSNTSASMGSNRDAVVTALNAIFSASDQTLGTIKNIDGITLTGIQDGQILTFDQSQASFVNSTISTDNLSNANLTFGSARDHSLTSRLDFSMGQSGGLFTVSTNDGLTNRLHIDNSKILLNGLEIPSSDGTSGQVLSTNGSGELSFVNQTVNTDTNTNLGDTDLTLSGNRSLNVDGNDFIIKDGFQEKLKYDESDDRFIFKVPVSFSSNSGMVAGELRLQEGPLGGQDYVALKAPSSIPQGGATFVLPSSDGSTGQFLKTDGSGNLSFASASPSRGGTYSWSGYSTDVTKTSTFYYQFPSVSDTSSSNSMLSSFVGQGTSHGTYGLQGAMTLNGLSSDDTVTYSITVKITTSTTVAIQTLSAVGSQFTPATAFAFSSGSEQTVTLSQSSAVTCDRQGGNQWALGLQVVFFAAGSIDFRVEDLSITVA